MHRRSIGESHRNFRWIHLKVFNDPAFDHVCEFMIRSHLGDFTLLSRPGTLCGMASASLMYSPRLVLPSHCWPGRKYFPELVFTQTLASAAARIGGRRRSVHASTGVNMTMVAGIRGGADVFFVGGDPVGRDLALRGFKAQLAADYQRM
jgi:hypothetical protein